MISLLRTVSARFKVNQDLYTNDVKKRCGIRCEALNFGFLVKGRNVFVADSFSLFKG